ncbi:hypothetical protein Unana1_02367 [Umbelopsis nana]
MKFECDRTRQRKPVIRTEPTESELIDQYIQDSQKKQNPEIRIRKAKQAAKKKIKQKDQANPTSVEPKDPFKYKGSDSVNILDESYSSNTDSDDEDFCEPYSEAEDNASQESYMEEDSQDVIDQQELEDLAQDAKDASERMEGTNDHFSEREMDTQGNLLSINIKAKQETGNVFLTTKT